DRVPRVALLGELPAGGAHALATGLVREQLVDRGGKRRDVARWERQADIGIHDSPIPIDVRRHDRRRACEGARENNPEALTAERRGDQRLRAEQFGGELLLWEEPPDLDSVLGDAEPGHQETDAERVGAANAERRARAPTDLRPRLKEDVQAL